MNIKSLFTYNIEDYAGLVDQDLAENMARMYFHGIAGHDPENDDPLAVLIWELKSVEDELNTESEIKLIYAADNELLKDLFAEYEKDADNEEVVRSFFEIAGLDEEKKDAVGGLGFSLSNAESRELRVTMKEIKSLSIAKKTAPSHIKNIASLSTKEYNQGMMNLLFRLRSGALEDITYLPIDWFEDKISCCAQTDGKVNGFLLIHACPSGILTPVLFCAVGGDYRRNLLEMMEYSINQAAKVYPDDTVVMIRRRTKEISALTEKLFPGKKGERVTVGERMERGY